MELTDADLRQVLSYACLHEPMIPIVAITNGATTRLHSTFDGEPIEDETLDEQKLVRLLQQGARRATYSREEVIKNLIGGDPTVWAKHRGPRRTACWTILTAQLTISRGR